MARAALHLGDAGYVVEERAAPLLGRGNEIYIQIMDRFSRATAARPEPSPGLLSADFERFWELFNEPWQRAAGESTHDPMMERATIAREWGALMEETPLVLAPIATQPAFRVGADLEADFGANWLAALRMVVMVNLLGLPAVAVPVGSFRGLPQAVQIIGPRFREDLCLAAAEVIEARVPRVTPLDPER